MIDIYIVIELYIYKAIQRLNLTMIVKDWLLRTVLTST